MTQTIERSTSSVSKNEWDADRCPEWCTNNRDGNRCRGEHYAVSLGSFILATGGHFAPAHSPDSPIVPTIGVGLYWAEHWGEGQELYLEVGDHTSLNFKPAEALALATEITTMLQAMVHASSISISGAERVSELVAMANSLDSMLTKRVDA